MPERVRLTEAERRKIEKDNERYMDAFQRDISKLIPAVQKMHRDNIKIFLYDYLMDYEGGVSMEKGLDYVDWFFNYYFVREVCGGTIYRMERMIATVKRFYRVMAKYNYIERRKLDRLNRLVKAEGPQWKASYAAVKGIVWGPLADQIEEKKLKAEEAMQEIEENPWPIMAQPKRKKEQDSNSTLYGFGTWSDFIASAPGASAPDDAGSKEEPLAKQAERIFLDAGGWISPF